MKGKYLIAAAALVVACLASAEAQAGPAMDVVKDKQSELFKIIEQPRTDARQAKLKALFDEMLDYKRLAHASLGKRWRDLDDEQQVEFSDLLERLVRKNYQRNLTKMLGYDIRYVAEKEVGAGKVLVKTRAVSRSDQREEPIELDFKLKQKSGRWLVIDIIPEGASLVRTYRSQFTRILKKDGYAALKRKMEKKLAKKLDDE
ncbi:MAG: ABC transporter substrate-binding protein [Deltaproteobacteria bacterium]|nr:ABC transporter substrate-binding protein [Deltaproteobacteria bacterium]MBW2536101.1 ABC transporter substrate-binding protein [Deltaproteobacteria bacterium]